MGQGIKQSGPMLKAEKRARTFFSGGELIRDFEEHHGNHSNWG